MDQTMYTCQTSAWIKLCTCARHPHGSNYVHVPDIHMDHTMYTFQTSTWIRLCTCSRHPHGTDYVSARHPHGTDYVYVPNIHMDQTVSVWQNDVWVFQTSIWIWIFEYVRHPHRSETFGWVRHTYGSYWHKIRSTGYVRLMPGRVTNSNVWICLTSGCVRYPHRSDWSMDVS